MASEDHKNGAAAACPAVARAEGPPQGTLPRLTSVVGTIRAFEAQVRRGLFPEAMPGTSQWDRRALDAAVQRLSSLRVTENPSVKRSTNASTDNLSRGQDTVHLAAKGSTPAAGCEMRGVKTVKKPRADGSTAVYHYHRATHTKLPGSPGSPEFQAVLAAARARRGPSAAQAAERRDLGSLIRKFCTSRNGGTSQTAAAPRWFST